MNRFGMAVAAVAAVIGSASPAFAQNSPTPTPSPAPGTGPIAPVTSGRPTGESRDDFVQRYSVEALFRNQEAARKSYATAAIEARCAVRSNAARAASLVGGEGTSDPNYQALDRAMSTRFRACVRDPQGRTVPVFVSAAIAEYLLTQDTSVVLGDRAMAVNVDDAVKFHGDIAGKVTLDKIARCMAVYSPGLARKVLDTEPGSPAEVAALDTVYLRTPECNVPVRPTNIPSVFQRAALAAALYAWTHKRS